MSKIVVFDHDGTLVDTHGVQKFLFDGIKEVISDLRKDGFELFIWTARSRASTIEILKSLGIISAFNELYCGNDNYPKPSTEGLKELLVGYEATDVVIIGDSYADMLGAKNYGAYAVGAAWDADVSLSYLKQYGADVIIKSPIDLLDCIKSYFKNKE